MEKSIHEIVRTAEQDYQTGSTNLGEFVSWSLRDTVERVIAYLNSKHTTGDQDSLGRDKPFFNIVTAAVNIWYRATDIDRKDIIIRPDRIKNTTQAFLGNILLREWMKKQKFGMFLNEWGRILAQFGSAVVKFVERDGELIPSVVPWNRLIVDSIDFDALPRIEKIYKTPAQLRACKEYDQDMVESLLDSLVSRKGTQDTTKDNIDEFIELYEVHGELPVGLLKDNPTDDDWKEYRQQMHVVSFVAQDDGTNKDFTLYKGKEAQDPYLLTHLIKEEGRVMSIGAVEYLFDSQWMQNHTLKNMKDTLDLAGKLIFQTSDGNFVGRNVLSAIETGDILIHKENQPLTQVNNYKADIVALQNFSNLWRGLAQELTSTPDSQRGINPPSGQPLGATQLINQNANSLFEIMVESKGLYLEEMLRRFILPHFKKTLNNSNEVMAVLEEEDIKKIDAMYIPNQAVRNHNRRVIENALMGKETEPFNQMAEELSVKNSLAPLGNMRSLTPTDLKGKEINWNEVFKDMEWKVEVGITNEPADKQAVLTSLVSLLTAFKEIFAGNPQALQLIAGKILTMTGVVSPVEISSFSVANPAMNPGANPPTNQANPTMEPLSTVVNKQ